MSRLPDIGRDIKWIEIIAQVFHVLDFDRAGTTIKSDGKLKTKGFFKPYGYLHVESPILNQSVRLPIVHRDDFLLADSVFSDPKWLQAIQEEELLVTYVPKHQLPGGKIGITHGLHYVITPKGTLERYYYSFNNDEHMSPLSRPAPEKLFGKLVWDGEIRVQVNSKPAL